MLIACFAERERWMTTVVEVSEPWFPRDHGNGADAVDRGHELQWKLLIGPIAPRGVELDQRERRAEALFQLHDTVQRPWNVGVECAKQRDGRPSQAIRTPAIWSKPFHLGASPRPLDTLADVTLGHSGHGADPA
jgi:hypothetical protein